MTFQAWSELALNRVNQVTWLGEPEENIRISEGLGFHHLERAFCHYKLYLSDDRVSCIISLYYITECGMNISTLSFATRITAMRLPCSCVRKCARPFIEKTDIEGRDSVAGRSAGGQAQAG